MQNASSLGSYRMEGRSSSRRTSWVRPWRRPAEDGEAGIRQRNFWGSQHRGKTFSPPWPREEEPAAADWRRRRLHQRGGRRFPRSRIGYGEGIKFSRDAGGRHPLQKVLTCWLACPSRPLFWRAQSVRRGEEGEKRSSRDSSRTGAFDGPTRSRRGRSRGPFSGPAGEKTRCSRAQSIFESVGGFKEEARVGGEL